MTFDFNWNSNSVMPDKKTHNILIYSKAYSFFGELYYNSGFYDNEEPYVENDEGYFKIDWKDVDGWYDIEKLKTEFAPELLNKDVVKKAKEEREARVQEEKQKIIPKYDINLLDKSYNILLYDGYSFTGDHDFNASNFYYFEGIKIKEYEDRDNGEDAYCIFEVQVNPEYSVTLSNYLNSFDRINSAGYKTYIISQTKSKTELTDIILNSMIKDHENLVQEYKKELEAAEKYLEKIFKIKALI